MPRYKSNPKIKRNQKIAKPCTECFVPSYLKFNFAYVVHDTDFSENEKYESQLLRRMRELSGDVYIVVTGRGKEKAFEFLYPEELGFKKNIPKSFTERFPESRYNGKLAIMRLYPNDNPILARVIGVVIKNVFYIMFIDIGGKLYKH